VNVPRGQDYAKLELALTRLKDNASFRVVVDWIRSERDARDVENRIRGHENHTTEAHALSFILQQCGTEGDSPSRPDAQGSLPPAR